MKIIYDVQSQSRAKVFSVLHSELVDSWTQERLAQFVQENYPNMIGVRFGANIEFPVSSGDVIVLGQDGLPNGQVVVPPVPDKIFTLSDAPMDSGMAAVPADGQSMHAVTVTRRNFLGEVVADNSTFIKAQPSQFLKVTPRRAQMVNGSATFMVGPSDLPGDVTIKISDESGRLSASGIALRFV